MTLETPSVSDNVEIASITSDAPSVFPVGKTIVTWTATDSSGNVQTTTQTINIVDTIPPKFAKMTPITVEATSEDDNHVELSVPKVTDIQDIASITSDAPSVFALGETIVTWTATDSSGNSATATQKVTVIDTTAPTIVPPVDVTTEASSANANVVDLGVAQATDAVTIASITSNAPSVFALGETIVTWTATDSSGNSATATQKVTVIDTTAPAIVAPSTIVFEATSPSENTISLALPEATDSVSEVTITSDAPSVFALGETIVTWTATDSSGNSATATQKVTVIDTTAPKLVIPDNIIVNAVSLFTPVEIGSATASDLTDNLPKITSDAPETFPIGKTTITWTAMDMFGNSMTQTQIVTVEACGKPESAYNKIIGSEDDDVLFGTTLADLIIGLGGDDIIYGDKGNDCILAGDGEDVVYGDEGNDYVHGGDGADIIKGQSGDDMLIGGLGNDIIDGGDDYDSCIMTENDNDIVVKCES
ncbi:Outer membrane phospholipase A (fragment) [Candidatus Nitrosotenuis uzonensis]|uniref:Outer membrane phospholipase A n=1 Tax=Candidatus Nitrosotenuis uzonensis TaxID=1407055 RepID=A0A812F6W8_9ARCH